MNVVGDAIDGMKDPRPKKEHIPIHREPPKFEDLATSQEVLYTGIKVIDLAGAVRLKVVRSDCSVVPVSERPCLIKELD